MHIDAYSKINESAQIEGVALIPRISRNNNLYTKKELERFDNVTVPLNWEHDPNNQIGSVTFSYNASQETVYYKGEITDESAANVARNKLLFTSIEAEPQGVKEICNLGDDCFAMPFGLAPKGLALTETPGVPETTVKVIENYIRECNHVHSPLEKGADYTKDFTEFKQKGDKIDKQIDKIMRHLDVEECSDCGELHSKKEAKEGGPGSGPQDNNKKRSMGDMKKHGDFINKFMDAGDDFDTANRKADKALSDGSNPNPEPKKPKQNDPFVAPKDLKKKLKQGKEAFCSNCGEKKN